MINFNFFWGVVLVTTPLIFRVTRGGLREGKDSFFWLAVMASLYFFSKSVRKFPLPEKIGLSILLVVSWFNVDNYASIGNFYHIVYITAGVLFLKNFYENFSLYQLDVIYKFIVITALVNITWAVVNKLGFSPYSFYAEYIAGIKQYKVAAPGKAIGPLNNSMLSGAMLAICGPVFFIKKYLKLLPLVIMGLYFYDSAIANISFIGSVLYFFFVCVLQNSQFKKQNLLVHYKTLPLILVLVVLIGTFLIIGPNGVSGFDSQRFLSWSLILSITDFKTFLVGNGTGWFYDHFPRMYVINGVKWYQEHSEYLASYMAFGVFGFIGFYALFSRALLRSKNVIASSALFGVFINCFGNFTLHISSLFLISGIFYCLCLSGVSNESKEYLS